MIAPVFFKDAKNGTEKDVALIYLAIMNFAVIAVVARTILKRFKKYQDDT
jgi:hypothetical protein